MTAPIFSKTTVDFSDWELGFRDDRTLKQNTIDIADCVLEETWGSLDASLDTSGLSIGTIYVTSAVEETFAFFKITDMTREAMHWIANNYSPIHRDKKIEETRQHMRAVRDKLAECLAIIDSAIDDPSRFYEPESISQKDETDGEVINYIKDMCGG